jgi:glyoxylase-like metal-dependent hydrolase (beta-lactamase superfamily II)
MLKQYERTGSGKEQNLGMPLSRPVGSATVIALQDGVGPFFEPRADAFPDATCEHWRLADERDPAAVTADGRWLLPFRCFAIRLADARVILVDAGIGPADALSRGWAPVPGQLPAELAAAGIDPDDVRSVVLTHLHSDHIGWAVVGEPYFRNADYLLQQAELSAADQLNPALRERLIDPLRRSGQLRIVDGDTTLATGLRVIATPGHTPGHQSVLLAIAGETVLITGDLLVHAVQLVDPGLAYAHEEDPVTARASRVALLDQLAGDATTLATPHLGDAFIPWPGRSQVAG